MGAFLIKGEVFLIKGGVWGRVAKEVILIKVRHLIGRSGKQKSSYENLIESPKYYKPIYDRIVSLIEYVDFRCQSLPR